MVDQHSSQLDGILEHVFRYRLTTPEILAGTEILPNASESAAALAELAGDGWLETSELCPGVNDAVFFHLNEKAAKHLGQDSIIAKPPSRHVRIEAWAVATFCCCGDRFRELFTKDEFKQRFANLWYAGQPVRYYLEPFAEGKVRLAYLKVDRGGASRWDRVIDSCLRFIRNRTNVSGANPKHRTHVEAFNTLAERGGFQISLLTSLEDKARAIREELQRKPPPAPPIVPYVVPGLFDVIHPRPQLAAD